MALDDWLARQYNGIGRADPSARGSYNSPLPDLAEVRRRAGDLFRKDIDSVIGIDLNITRQLTLLRDLGGYAADCRWPEAPSAEGRYYSGNDWYHAGDAAILAGVLRHFRPGRVVEIGSGFSSAAMLDTCDRHLRGVTRLTFIEPRSARLRMLLRGDDATRADVIESDVQAVPLGRLTGLESGDVLFIDSSHVSRIGSDVNYLVFEVLPRLPAGCMVHFHDIFWPFEYPPDWVYGGYAWNEAYLLRAFLMNNSAFEILLFSDYLVSRHPEVVRTHVPQLLDGRCGSLWVRKVIPAGAG